MVFIGYDFIEYGTIGNEQYRQVIYKEHEAFSDGRSETFEHKTKS